MQAHNLIGLINEYTRNREIPIGKIDIMGRFSFFEVSNDFESDILSGFSDAVWNGNRVNVEISQAPGTKSSRGGRKRNSGSSYSVAGRTKNSKRKRKNGKTSLDSSSSRKKSNERSLTGDFSSFKGKFNAAAKRKRNN